MQLGSGVRLAALLLLAVGVEGHAVSGGANAIGADTIEAAKAEVSRLEVMLARLEAEAHIAPTLNPVSDKTFFDGHTADYPTDVRPAAPHHFQYPYPSVQADNSYDADYTTDENGDDGHWHAQTEYDRLRIEASKIEGRLLKAAQLEQDKASGLDHAKADEAKAHSEVDADHQKVQDAKNEAAAHEKARKDRQDAASKAAAGKEGDIAHQIELARQKVSDEEKDYEECKAQLENAKKKLAELQAAQSNANATAAEKEAEAAADEKAENDLKAKLEVAEAEEAESKKTEATMEAKVAEEATEHDEAVKSVEEEKARGDKLRKELEKARQRLAGLKGGGDSHPHSGAARRLVSVALGLAGLRAVL